MTIFAWNCKTVDAYPSYDSLTDVVYNVHWVLSAERVEGEETYSSSCYGTESISLEDLSPASFVPVEDLTNEIVTGWVEASMGAEAVAEKKASLEASLDAQINPTSVTITLGS